MAENNNQAYALIAIVAIVAVVGTVSMLGNNRGTPSTTQSLMDYPYGEEMVIDDSATETNPNFVGDAGAYCPGMTVYENCYSGCFVHDRSSKRFFDCKCRCRREYQASMSKTIVIDQLHG